jgi:simple sugar transport system substrate-binding protein
MDGPLTNFTWAATNQGFQSASKTLNAETKYLSPQVNVTDVNSLLQLMRDAQGQKPDGMIINDDHPSAQDPLIQQITASGIPVMLVAIGAESVATTGAIGFVGLDSAQQGRTAGQKLNALGCKHLLNVALIRGQAPYSDLVTDGLQATFQGQLTSTQIPITMTNDIPAATAIVRASLLKDTSIDCTFVVGVTLYPAMVAAEENLGARTDQLHSHSGGAAATKAILEDVVNHKVNFALNLQFFQEGYLAVTGLVLYIRYHQLPAQKLLIRQQVVTIDNASQLLEQFKNTGIM